MNTTIEICVHFLTDQHIHQTKSSVVHLYVPALQVIIEHDEAMAYIVEVMEPIITYVEVIFLHNFSLPFTVIYPMPICDIHHQGNLLRVIILTLDLILRLHSVVLGKINN